MKGWKLTFKYKGKGVVIDLEYVGADRAIRFALGLLGLTGLGEQLQRTLGADELPDGLLEEALMVSDLTSGVPFAAYEGKFLRVEPVERVSGLSTSVHVQW